MKKITVLALPEGLMMGVSIPSDVFRIADRIWRRRHEDDPLPLFDLQVAATDRAPVPCAGGTRILPDAALGEITHSDLIVVPGITRYDDAYFDSLRPVVRWLIEMHRRGIPIATFCTGAFVLAETDLLDQREAATHWAYETLFRARYPQVRLKSHRLMTVSRDICCAGGANTGIDLCLYLLAQLTDTDLARRTAKVLVHDFERESQAPYAVFAFEKNHRDGVIKQIQGEIESGFAGVLDIDALSRTAGLSRRTLERKFKQATGLSPLSYLQEVRIEAAKRLLETGTVGFEEITARVGYEDPGSFRKLFIKRCGVSPAAYQRKFLVRWPHPADPLPSAR